MVGVWGQERRGRPRDLDDLSDQSESEVVRGPSVRTRNH